MVGISHTPYPKPTSAAVTAVMKANKRSNTKPEVAIRAVLHKIGYRFRKDLLIRTTKGTCRPDIVFKKVKLAIFIDGCFWHLCPEHGHIPKSNINYWEPKLRKNKERDEADTRLLTDNGWAVLRLWEHVTIKESIKIVANRISILTKDDNH